MPRNEAYEFGLRMEALKKQGRFNNTIVPVQKQPISMLMAKRRQEEKYKWFKYICDFNERQLKGKGKRIVVHDVPHILIKTVIHEKAENRNKK